MPKRNIPSIAAVAALLILWQLLCSTGLIPSFMLPSPLEVIRAFFSELPMLAKNSVITLQEAFIGLFLGVSVGFCAAVLMDTFKILYKAFYPSMEAVAVKIV
jgi:ABC-type nitrate/sulfonate/bicarbonate transport system permease component